MSFRLLIECSKDLDTLQINFSDGTSVVKHTDSILNSKIKNVTTSDTSNSPSNDVFLDTNAEFGNIQNEIVEKPVIEQRQRDVLVADELQNLDI